LLLGLEPIILFLKLHGLGAELACLLKQLQESPLSLIALLDLIAELAVDLLETLVVIVDCVVLLHKLVVVISFEVLLHTFAVGSLLLVAADLLPKLCDHAVLSFVFLPQALFLVSLRTLKPE
jgi:hypothetical protein